MKRRFLEAISHEQSRNMHLVMLDKDRLTNESPGFEFDVLNAD